MTIPLTPLYPSDYSGMFSGSETGDPTKPATTPGPVRPDQYGPPSDVVPKGPLDLSGLNLEWLKSPGSALASGAQTAIGYAGLALLGVLLIVVSVYVILNDRGGS